MKSINLVCFFSMFLICPSGVFLLVLNNKVPLEEMLVKQLLVLM
jgi:hypothetical protein